MTPGSSFRTTGRGGRRDRQAGGVDQQVALQHLADLGGRAELAALRGAAEVVHRERPPAEGVAAVGGGPGADEAGHEAGPGVAGHVEVAHLEVRGQGRVQLEPVERAPFPGDQGLQLVHAVAVAQPERLVRRRLLHVGQQGEHAGQRLSAEPDVDDVRPSGRSTRSSMWVRGPGGASMSTSRPVHGSRFSKGMARVWASTTARSAARSGVVGAAMRCGRSSCRS